MLHVFDSNLTLKPRCEMVEIMYHGLDMYLAA